MKELVLDLLKFEVDLVGNRLLEFLVLLYLLKELVREDVLGCEKFRLLEVRLLYLLNELVRDDVFGCEKLRLLDDERGEKLDLLDDRFMLEAFERNCAEASAGAKMTAMVSSSAVLSVLRFIVLPFVLLFDSLVPIQSVGKNRALQLFPQF